VTKSSAYRLAKEAWLLAIEKAGGQGAIARALCISIDRVCHAQTCARAWLVQIERLSGVPRQELRPDLYR
jgi:Putative antitoxin of bacterial toxin-antitoxin system, YdaS/YdaT